MHISRIETKAPVSRGFFMSVCGNFLDLRPEFPYSNIVANAKSTDLRLCTIRGKVHIPAFGGRERGPQFV